MVLEVVEKLLEYLFESIDDAMAFLSPDLDVLLANGQFVDLIGNVENLDQMEKAIGMEIALPEGRKSRKELIKIPDRGIYLFIVVPVHVALVKKGYMIPLLPIEHLPEDFITLEDQNISISDIFDILPAYLFFKNLHNRYLYVNKAFAEELRSTKSEITGKTTSELFASPNFANKAFGYDKKVIETGQPIRGIIEPLTVNGLKWLKSDKFPVRDRAGNIIGTLGFSIDITEEKKARDKADFQANLLRNVRESVIATDLNGRIIYLGQGALELFGFDEGAVIGMDIVEALKPERPGDFRQRLVDAANEGASEAVEVYCGKRHFHAESIISLVKNSKGMPIALVFTDRDIEERVRSQKRLAESEAVYRNFVNQSSDGIFMFRENGEIVEWNKAMETITGLTRENAVGEKVWTIQHRLMPKDMPYTVDQLKAIIESYIAGNEIDQSYRDGNRRLRHIDGSIKSMLMKLTRIDTGSGILFGTIAKDITDIEREQRSRLDTERIYRLIVQNVSDGLIVLDRKANILVWNHAMEDITGIREEIAKQTPVYELRYNLLDSETRKQMSLSDFKEHYRQVINNFQKNYQSPPTIETIVNADGKSVHIENRIFSFDFQDREMMCFMIREIDIS